MPRATDWRGPSGESYAELLFWLMDNRYIARREGLKLLGGTARRPLLSSGKAP